MVVYVSVTDADKQVWLEKLIATLISVFVFSITYFFTNDVIVSSTIIALVGVVAAIITIGIRDFIAGTAAAALAVLAVVVAIIYSLGIALVTGFVTASDTVVTAVAAATIVALFTVVVIGLKHKKYKITFLSNILSAILQFLIMWLGLYAAQHLVVHTPFR